MATLTLNVSYISDDFASIDWEVDGIGLNMTEGGICTGTPDGSYNEPGAILDSAAARSSGTLQAASGSYTAYRSDYPGRTFSCNGYGLSTGGRYFSAGGRKSVTLTWPAPPPVRPPNWSWWSDVRAGQPVAFTSAEFQAFYNKIDEFRVYKFGPGNEWPNFIPVSKGTPLSAAIVNEARAAIAPMTTATMPPTAYAGVTKISADYFNKLENYLNSVT